MPFTKNKKLCNDKLLSCVTHKKNRTLVSLQKPGIKKQEHTWRVGELRLITLTGPEMLTLQALSFEQRG